MRRRRRIIGLNRYVRSLSVLVLVAAAGCSSCRDEQQPKLAQGCTTASQCAPDTTILSGPASLTNVTEATFTFSVTDVAAADQGLDFTYECRLDPQPWQACDSPATVTVETDGNKLFEVRGVHPQGFSDTTPAEWIWHVDTEPPVLYIRSEQFSSTSVRASFTFECRKQSMTDEEFAQCLAQDSEKNCIDQLDLDTCEYECGLDGTWTTCSSPVEYADLTEGEHTFEVRAYDEAGNPSLMSALQRSWTINLPLWSFDAGSQVSRVLLSDLNQNGIDDILVDTAGLQVLDGTDGSVRWGRSSAGDFAAGDLEGDGSVEVVVGEDDRVYARRGTDGAEIWSFQTSEPVAGISGLGDFSRNGITDIVAYSIDPIAWLYDGEFVGDVYVLDGTDSTVHWSVTTVVGNRVGLGDVNADGNPDIVMSLMDSADKQMYLYAFSGSTGTVLWSMLGGNFALQDLDPLSGLVGPTLADIDNNGRNDVFVGSGEDETLYAFEGSTSSERWSFFADGDVYDQPAIGDLTGDSELDVVFTTASTLYVLSGSDGSLQWSVELGCRAPVLADVDDDGVVDVLCASDRRVYALHGADGSELWQRVVDGARELAVGDVNGDGMLEVVVGTGDGTIYAFSTNSPVPSDPAMMPWPMRGHDAKRTGQYTGGPQPPW